MKTLTKHCEGYPKDLADLFDDSHLNFSFNGAVFDLTNERILKLSGAGIVLKAYNGFTKLTGIFNSGYKMDF
jgi:hypothetical protein